jgi:hypothetical protein
MIEFGPYSCGSRNGANLLNRIASMNGSLSSGKQARTDGPPVLMPLGEFDGDPLWPVDEDELS